MKSNILHIYILVGWSGSNFSIWPHHFKKSSDYNNPDYNTEYGVYLEGCELNNILMSWRHGDYCAFGKSFWIPKWTIIPYYDVQILTLACHKFLVSKQK